MRVGNAFSRALDPAKPLLFATFPLDLLQEEQWHPSAARLDPQDPLRLQPAPCLKPLNTPRAGNTSAAAAQPSSTFNHSRSDGSSETSSSGAFCIRTGDDSINTANDSTSNRGRQDSRAQQSIMHANSSCGRKQAEAVDGVRHDDSEQQSIADANSSKGSRLTGGTEGSKSRSNKQELQYRAEHSWGSDHVTDSDDDSLEAYDLSEGDDEGEGAITNLTLCVSSACIPAFLWKSCRFC